MKLPTIDFPTYEVKLISQDAPIHIRPFLVREEKLMLMAVEADDIDDTVRAIKQIIKNCVQEDIDVDALPIADIEILFLNLRAKSMGEVLNLFFTCKNKVDGANCDMIVTVDVPVADIKVVNKNASRRIMLSDDVGVDMNYPSFAMIERINASNNDVDVSIVASCIEDVFDKESIHHARDATPSEMEDFVNNLPVEKYDLLEHFIENSPKTRYETKQMCPKCKYEHDFVLEGLQDFFV